MDNTKIMKSKEELREIFEKYIYMDGQCESVEFHDVEKIFAEIWDLFIQYADQKTSELKAENERLKKEIIEWKEAVKFRDFMIENGLGPEDMKNDITYPHEL